MFMDVHWRYGLLTHGHNSSEGREAGGRERGGDTISTRFFERGGEDVPLSASSLVKSNGKRLQERGALESVRPFGQL